LKAPPPGGVFAFLLSISRGLVGGPCPLDKGGAPGPTEDNDETAAN